MQAGRCVKCLSFGNIFVDSEIGKSLQRDFDKQVGLNSKVSHERQGIGDFTLFFEGSSFLILLKIKMQNYSLSEI